MHSLQIERQTHQIPFPAGRLKSPHTELAKAQDVFDPAIDRFHDGLATGVARFALSGTKLLGHALRCRFRLRINPGRVAPLASEADIALNRPVLKLFKVRFVAVTRIGEYRGWCLAQIALGPLDQRQQFTVVARLRRQLCLDNELMRIIYRQLPVVALLITIGRFHDAAFGVREVALRLVLGNPEVALETPPPRGDLRSSSG